MKKKVWFRNNLGHKLAGDLYLPKGQKKPPVVIVLHGYKGSREGISNIVASRVIRSGLAAFIFDRMGLGESEGKFENTTVSQEVRDIKSAVDFIDKRKEIQNKRIGLIASSGSSYSSLVFCSQDKRIRSLILTVPVIDFFKLMHFEFLPKNLKIWQKEGKITSQTSGGKKRILKYDFVKDLRKYNLFKIIKKVYIPILFHYAKNDQDIHEAGYDTRRLYKAFDFDLKNLYASNTGHSYHKSKKSETSKIFKAFKSWFDIYLKRHKESGITAILKRGDGKILLVKRSLKVWTHPGQWNGIGGYISKGETPREAALREIKEELSIEKKFLKHLKITKPYRWYESSYDKDWEISFVLLHTKKTKLKLNWEADRYQWINPVEINKFKLVPHFKKGFKRLGLL